MKRAYRTSQYAKPCEQYCRETYPDEAAAILQKAEEYYRINALLCFKWRNG